MMDWTMMEYTMMEWTVMDWTMLDWCMDRTIKKYDPLYFSFLGGVILLQLFGISASFRDIGRCHP